jgi:adenylate kinase
MGVAGSGKGTQGALLAEKLGYTCISSGELLRSLLTGERLAQITAGKLLSDNETIDLIDQKFNDDNLDLQKVILDGFPRTQKQAEWLMKQVNEGRLTLTAVYNFLATEEVVRKRLLLRGREDDNESGISERFNEYVTKTVPMINYFKNEGVPVFDIDADQTPEEVNKTMLAVITK